MLVLGRVIQLSSLPLLPKVDRWSSQPRMCQRYKYLRSSSVFNAVAVPNTYLPRRGLADACAEEWVLEVSALHTYLDMLGAGLTAV